jgi:hypothetical protein
LQNTEDNTGVGSAVLRNVMSCPFQEFFSACYLLHAGFLNGLFLDPEDGVDFSSETSVDFQQSTQRFIP